MKKRIAAAVLSLSMLTPVPVSAHKVRKYAPHHGADVWADIDHCESGHGRHPNHFQFILPTWRKAYRLWFERWGEDYGPALTPAHHPFNVQLAVAMDWQTRAGWGQWPACSRAVGLR